MLKGSSVVTFSIAEPYPVAVRMVRRAFEQQGLRVPAELNVTARIKQELGAGLAPCVVLYVDDPVLLLEAVIFQRGAALLIPQPVVISGTNHHTEVLLRSAESLASEDQPAGLRDPVVNLHTRIVKAMESIAEREGAHLMASP